MLYVSQFKVSEVLIYNITKLFHCHEVCLHRVNDTQFNSLINGRLSYDKLAFMTYPLIKLLLISEANLFMAWSALILFSVLQYTFKT